MVTVTWPNDRARWTSQPPPEHEAWWRRVAGGTALLLGGAGSWAFILVNAILVVVALVKGQAVEKPLIACVFPSTVVA